MKTAKVKTLFCAFAPLAASILALPFYKFAVGKDGLMPAIGIFCALMCLFDFTIRYCFDLADKGLQLTALAALGSHIAIIFILSVLPIALWSKSDYNLDVRRFACLYMACLIVTGLTVLFSWRKFRDDASG